MFSPENGTLSEWHLLKWMVSRWWKGSSQKWAVQWVEKRLVKFCENSGNMFNYLTHCVWGKRQNTNQNQESENGQKNWRSNPKSGNTLNYPTHCVPARRQNTEEKLIERGWVGSRAGQTSHFHPFLRLVVNFSWCPKRPRKFWCDFVDELFWDKEKTS